MVEPSKSGLPREKAIPALVVPRTWNPASARRIALPASHAFGITKPFPLRCIALKVSAFVMRSNLSRAGPCVQLRILGNAISFLHGLRGARHVPHRPPPGKLLEGGRPPL